MDFHRKLWTFNLRTGVSCNLCTNCVQTTTYRWVQGATKTVTSKSGAKCTKYYFKTQVAKRSVTDDSFQKRVIVCTKLYPNRVLIRYLGDEKSAKWLAHGNSKNPNKNFTRTKDSELQKLKMVRKNIR